MPKLSKRQQLIKEISSLLKKRLAARQYRILFEEEDGIDEAAHCIDLVVAAAVVKAQIMSDKPILVAQSNSNSTPKNFLIINLKLAAIRSFLGQSGAWHSCWTAPAILGHERKPHFSRPLDCFDVDCFAGLSHYLLQL
eukprot:scaffold4973_cov135-Cylindrotheca_fusiformis.AAC.1